jgi:formylmethanofuran dehydrogenase subunit E
MTQQIDEKTLEALAAFHGHRCPASLYGLRAAYLALGLLDAKRAKDHELFAITETGYNHFANCFGDGIQFGTGATFGKDTITKNPLGKFAFTLIRTTSKKAVRVALKAEALKVFMESNFFKMRKDKIPPDQLPPEDVAFVMDTVLKASDEDLFSYRMIKDYPWQQKTSSFEALVCDDCDEAVVASYVVSLDGKHYCQTCANKMLIS